MYTGEKFETGLAFFADGLGRISRFSREPADLAAARRLPGQAALPGLINGHSIAWHRALRGRTETRVRAGTDPLATWNEALERLVTRLTSDDVFEIARMAFTEMMLSGVTCVGEFHVLHWLANAASEPNALAQQVLRAAHDVGVRIVLFNVATLRGGSRQSAGTALAWASTESADRFVRDTEALRLATESQYASDEAWLGVGIESLATVPLDAIKPLATYAHAQRMRVQARLGHRSDDAEACAAEYGRGPVSLLAEQGVIDKRFTAVHGIHLGDDAIRTLGTARAAICVCPSTEHNFALGMPPIERVLAAGSGLSLGTGSQVQIDLLKDARFLEYGARVAQRQRPALAPDSAKTLFHAATVTGARSLGATGGALEVGRPADFFTVNLYDPSIAGADPESLLANIVFSLERRAIREVWVGARQRVVNGRHPNQNINVGRFAELQRRLWSAT